MLTIRLCILIIVGLTTASLAASNGRETDASAEPPQLVETQYPGESGPVEASVLMEEESGFPLEAMVAGQIMDLSLVAENFSHLDASKLIWMESREFLGSEYLRLHFTGFLNPGSESFRMVISNGRGQQIEYNQDTWPGVDFWTPMVMGGNVSIKVFGDPLPTSLSFTLKEVAFQSDQGAWESIIGPSELQHMREFADDEVMVRIGRAVAKLTFFDGDFKVCSGFLISGNRLLTNHHCVATDEVCNTTMVIFGYELNDIDTPVFGEQVACKSVLASDFRLDFAVLELHGDPGTEWGVIAFSNEEIADGDPLYIVQHPAGEPKQVSIINCSADTAIVDGRGIGTDIAHVCDTKGGSSGSPVLNMNNEVVGLHHFGVGQGNFWNKNRAVRIGLVEEMLPEGND